MHIAAQRFRVRATNNCELIEDAYHEHTAENVEAPLIKLLTSDPTRPVTTMPSSRKMVHRMVGYGNPAVSIRSSSKSGVKINLCQVSSWATRNAGRVKGTTYQSI